MGGGGGYSFNPSDLERLEKKAKDKLTEGDSPSKRNVFISFVNEDIGEVNLLRGQAKNEGSDLEFSDYSVKEPFDSKNAEYIKRNIKEKIEKTSITLVYVTKDTAASKWVRWEVEQSLKMGKGVLAVYKGDKPPSNIPQFIKDNNIKLVTWSHKKLTKAIEKTAKKR
jgi:DNA-directed RNA polymerase subunit L